jgi:hypothetical protein
VDCVVLSISYLGPTSVLVEKAKSAPGGGFVQHLITTGLQNLYEGITVATVVIAGQSDLKGIMWGSSGNLITATWDDAQGRRCVIDGGFTRLYHKWDSAGTARFVSNAAAWLYNYEANWREYRNQSLPH